jgi:hypothetical protein
MKIKVLLSLMILSSIAVLKAQQITVSLQHNGKATMFYGNNALNDANTAAQNGDTVYLPGKAYYPGFNITKKLIIIGAGYNPDSTTATGRTIIQGDIDFMQGSGGSVLEGIYTDNNIHFYTTSISHSNYIRLSRCNVYSVIFDNSFDTTLTYKHVIIEQNIIRGGMTCSSSDYIIIRNNLINSRIDLITQNALIENNILFYQTNANVNSTLYNVNNSLIRNNIFMLPAINVNSYFYGCSNNDIMNNVFATAVTDWDANLSNNYTNNYTNVRTDSLFTGQTSYFTEFDSGKNYHLKDHSIYPGFNNLGVGIYGGTVPFKEGGLPFNPHFSQKTIAPNTDVNGNLNINLKVKAQNN